MKKLLLILSYCFGIVSYLAAQPGPPPFPPPTNTQCSLATRIFCDTKKVTKEEFRFNDRKLNGEGECNHTPFELWYFFQVNTAGSVQLRIKGDDNINSFFLYGAFPGTLSGACSQEIPIVQESFTTPFKDRSTSLLNLPIGLYLIKLMPSVCNKNTRITIELTAKTTAAISCAPSTSQITGMKWNDTDGDGIKDAAEPGLPNWAINLSNGMTATTDVLGNYSFNAIAPGTYTVAEVNQNGWKQTFPVSGSHSVTVAVNQVIGNINFGNQACPPPANTQCVSATGIFCNNSDTTAEEFCFNDKKPDNTGCNNNPFTLWYFFNVTSSGALGGRITALNNINHFAMYGPFSGTLNDACGQIQSNTAPLLENFTTPFKDHFFSSNSTNLQQGLYLIMVMPSVCNSSLTITADFENNIATDCIPPPADTCTTDTLLVNTGFNHTTGLVYPIPAADFQWTVVNDPDAGTTEPRPAFTIPVFTIPPLPPSWSDALPDSRWISSYPTAANDRPGDYEFENCFCLDKDFNKAQLHLELRADCHASVFLNDVLIGSTPNPGFKTINPTVIDVDHRGEGNTKFRIGKNCIRIIVNNENQKAMGLNVAGYVTTENNVRLEIPQCCNPTAMITGMKWNDEDGDSIKDAGEAGLPNWVIKLSNGTTATTDQLGNYYFNNISPGTYTVTEVNQNDWKQTFPASGSYSITVGINQVVDNINFGNQLKPPCPPPTNTQCLAATGIFCNNPHITTEEFCFNDNKPSDTALCNTDPFTLWYFFYVTSGGALGGRITALNNINRFVMYGPFSGTLSDACGQIQSNTAPVLENVTAPFKDHFFSSNSTNLVEGLYLIMVMPSVCNSSLTIKAHFENNLATGCIPPADTIGCINCIGSFSPIPGKKYVISAWAKEEGASAAATTYTNPQLVVEFIPSSTPFTFTPAGQIIDGWQRIEGEFTVPLDATDIHIQLNSLSGNAFFDDIRVFPFDGLMTTFVFDPITLRLAAQLDERHYATLYEYNEEGILVEVKKETERGVMSIQHTTTSIKKKQ